jgi:cell division protein FtsW
VTTTSSPPGSSPAGSQDAVEPDDPESARPTARGTRSDGTRKNKRGHESGLRTWLRQSRRSVSRLAADWLDRPMTSLHLVLAIFALMLGFGLLMVLSSSSVSAFRTGGSSFSVFANQATYAVVGLICFCAAQYVPVRVMRSLSTAAVIISLALLVAVLIPGVGALVNGAQSWIRLGGLQFQPSEVAKLALLVWMSHVLAARRSTLRSPKALLVPVLPVFALMAALIMKQPDLGTSVALTIVFMAVLFFAGAPRWTFAGLGAAGLVGFFALALSADYRTARLLSFVNPEAHPVTSYQLLQSLYGMGNGGWFGVGLGQSRAKWSYLPNADSDFIFAIIGEELGLIGAGILLLLFALLAYTGLRIARRNVDPFVKIVASAGTVWLVGQAAINIGYVVGLLPVTGIPLPMISAGGTSLLITMVVFGLLANFARREPQAAAALHAGGGHPIARFLGMHPSSRPQRASRRRRVPRLKRAPSARPAASAPRTGRAAVPPQRWSSDKRSSADRERQSARAGGDRRMTDPRSRAPRAGDQQDPGARDPRARDPRARGPRPTGGQGTGDPRRSDRRSGAANRRGVDGRQSGTPAQGQPRRPAAPPRTREAPRSTPPGSAQGRQGSQPPAAGKGRGWLGRRGGG